MPSNVFRFKERWELPGAKVRQVYDVLSRGELLPQWWKGVYLEAEKLTPGANQKWVTAFGPERVVFCPMN